MAGDIVEADLLGKLGADVAFVGLVDGVKLEFDHDLAAAVDEIGEGEVDVGERLLRSADDEGALAFVDGDLFDVEDVFYDIAEFVHLIVRHARDVDGLLQLTFETLAIVWIVFGDEYAFVVERDGEEMGHVEQDGHGLLVGRVVQIEAEGLPLHGLVEDGTHAVAGQDLADDVLLIGVKMEALQAGVGQEGDGAGEGWGLRLSRVLSRGERPWVGRRSRHC